ncbi:MAG: DNA-directed RNA polymerase subunit omega [Acidobacteria bacterium]|nr:DNA-directed RNA polymerase subunit omega [Acidobacteriota bacterium]
MFVPEDVGSKYRMIVLAGQRVAQLQKGAKPRVTCKEREKYTTVATREVMENKIDYKHTPDHPDFEG